MEVYLIRHGIAAERGTYADDEQRPLIDRGRDKTTKVAERLLTIGVKFDLILSSPLVRASQTAEILKKVGLGKTINTFAPLKPNGNIEEWLQWLHSWQSDRPKKKLALVGHQPDLGNWAEMLLWGTVKGQITLKKAGVVGIDLPNIGTPISRSTLFLLTSPKWLLREQI
ncbi:phosphohistidine phosphatase SixA [Pleurocapsales cyanobacterium LEGE 10410]|nr:phosphohistidine phosphatase SixA [Pleurocapsales cyanobacterium LEGE 10410]